MARASLPGVIVPARLDYAVRASVTLARATAPWTKVADIAAEHGFSRKFLSQTLGALRDADLVSTRRGSCGGYALARPAGEITVADVFDAIATTSVDSGAPKADRNAWARIERTVRTGLDGLTLAELAGADARPGAGISPGRARRR